MARALQSLGGVRHSTEKPETAGELRGLELADVIEALPDGVAIHDGVHFRYVNESLAISLGCAERAQVLKRSISDFVLPAQQRRADNGIAKVLEEGGQSKSLECRCRRLDGKVVQLSVWGARVRYRDEPAVLLVVKNLSEEERHRRQLFLADRMATLGLLAAGVAHEINNPLTYLGLTLSQLTRRLSPCGYEATLLDRADDAIVRIRDIVAALRSYSSSPSAPTAPVDVHAALEAALRIAGHRLRGRARLVRDFGELPMVMAEEAKLVQVFVNLIVNAADAISAGDSDENEVCLRTSSEVDRVLVEVRDTGCGMSPEVLDHAFEVFFTTKSVVEGTGLGLPLSREIVEALGGKLTVDSREGVGTAVTVILPACACLDERHGREKDGK